MQRSLANSALVFLMPQFESYCTLLAMRCEPPMLWVVCQKRIKYHKQSHGQNLTQSWNKKRIDCKVNAPKQSQPQSVYSTHKRQISFAIPFARLFCFSALLFVFVLALFGVSVQSVSVCACTALLHYSCFFFTLTKHSQISKSICFRHFTGYLRMQLAKDGSAINQSVAHLKRAHSSNS